MPRTSTLTPQNTAILLIDHQPGVVNMIGSLPHEVVKNNVGILARLGELTDLALVVTTTREEIEFLGTSIDEVQQGAPTAYAARVARGGSLDAFADDRFTAAVAATGRDHLVIAGVLTDVCLWNSALSAKAKGYDVRVIADASGTTTQLADLVTYDNFRALGIEVSTTYGTLFDMFDDLSTTSGQLAELIASGQPVPA